MAKPRPVLLTAALSAAAVLGYLSYQLLAGGGAPATGVADNGPSGAPPAVATLPDFSLANLAGEQQSIQSWPGKPMLINFWATWCGPCLREIPMLKELQAVRPDLQVVGIAIDKPDLVTKFAGDSEFN
jgi:thiol-disulfide isomerase/thioredoxin